MVLGLTTSMKNIQTFADLKGLKVPKETTIIIVEDSRIALAICACNFYSNPSRLFTLIGVTGTKGKTTTCYMIKSILEKAGKKVGLIGTIENYIGDISLGVSPRTTLRRNFHYNNINFFFCHLIKSFL